MQILSGGKDVASRALVLQGTHKNSIGSVSSRLPKGSGFGSIRGKSQSVSGMLNSIDSHRVHDTLKQSVGKALSRGRSKNSLINGALRRISKMTDAHASIPGLPVGTVSGRELTTSHQNIIPSIRHRNSLRTGSGITSQGGISARSRSRSRSRIGVGGRHSTIGRRRGSHVTTARSGHGKQNGGVSMAHRSRHRSSSSRAGHLSRASKLRGTTSHLIGNSHGHHVSASGMSQHGSMTHSDLINRGNLASTDLIHGGHLGTQLASSNAVSQGPSDAHLLASILDQGHSNGNPYDVTALLPNFIAEEPRIFLDKQTSVRNAYPQIVVGRPEPLLAAPVLPIALGSDGHVLTSSNSQIKEVLKSVLNTLSSSKSLSQQNIGSLMQSIRNSVDDQKKILVTGVPGPKIELSPIIHAGSKAVSTENIIRIKEPGKVSPIVLKTGGQLEISSGVSGNPAFKIYGFLPAKYEKKYNDESDNDEKKKKKE